MRLFVIEYEEPDCSSSLALHQFFPAFTSTVKLHIHLFFFLIQIISLGTVLTFTVAYMLIVLLSEDISLSFETAIKTGGSWFAGRANIYTFMHRRAGLRKRFQP